MKKLTPMISAFIPVIISLVVFDNVIFTDKNLRTNFENTAISHTYYQVRNIFAEELKPLKNKRNEQKSELIRNVSLKIEKSPRIIATNWKSSTLLQ
jgi:hypothetical protein